MVSVQEIILLFTKYPLPGKSKTRLIPTLGAQGAADLQKVMTQLIAGKLLTISARNNYQLTIFHEGGNDELMKHWLGDSFSFSPQPFGDLGAKMSEAICGSLKLDSSIILVGSDCPGIDAEIINDAFTALRTNNVVIGPAYDGGYYLIGIQGDLSKSVVTQLFKDIEWGSKNVLRQTLQRVKKEKLNYHLVKQLHDIDTPDDLKYFNHNPNP